MQSRRILIITSSIIALGNTFLSVQGKKRERERGQERREGGRRGEKRMTCGPVYNG
jgi:hypothetical protein